MEIKTIAIDDERELNSLMSLYQQVWRTDSVDFRSQLKRHATYPGFRGFVAYQDQQVVGFSYGYTSQQGQFYHDLLRQTLNQKQKWLDNCFEFVELLVHPLFRRKNIGKQLTIQLISDIPHQTAILTTQMSNVGAQALYRSLDWVIIQENFRPNQSAEPYVIMAKKVK